MDIGTAVANCLPMGVSTVGSAKGWLSSTPGGLNLAEG
jgi:hypothetical protein